jgi:hypothetical protein
MLARSDRSRRGHGLGLGAVDLQARRGPLYDRSGVTGASHARDGFDPFSFRCLHPDRLSHGGRSRASAFPSGPPCARRWPRWARRRARNAHRLSRGSSDRHRRLRRPRLRLTGGPRRKQREWVEIAVRVSGQADPEVDVRLSPLGISARADRAHDLAFRDRGPSRHPDRAEVDERDRVAVRRPDGQAQPFAGKLSCERDDARGRGPDVGAGRRGDVDSTVLAAGVGVVLGDERPQHGAVDWPSPGTRARAQNKTEQDRRRKYDYSVALFDNHEAIRLSGGSAVVKCGYSEPRYSRFREIPVSRDTTSAACRRRAPASTSSESAASASPSSPSSAVAPPNTTVISPFGGSANCAATSAAVPRTTSSKRFVSSRHTATDRSGQRAANDARLAGSR